MTPFYEIERKYAANPQQFPFGFYLDWHHRHGFVFSTPDYFIMGRAVDKDAFDPEVLDIAIHGKLNAWYIHAMAGSLSKAWDILPFPLGWLGWERVRGGQRELGWYKTEEIRRLSRSPYEIPQLLEV